MLGKTWKAKSLRFWLVFGLAVAVLPLAASAILSYRLLHRGVVEDFADVASRQRYQLVPTYRLRTLLTELVEPVDEFVDSGDATTSGIYRANREQVEVAFADLQARLRGEPDIRSLIERAREDWTAADRVATEVLSVRRPAGDASGVELMERFHGLVSSSVDKLAALGNGIEREIARDHDDALRFYERAEWLTGVAAGISLIAIVAGVWTISRIVSSSVDRLVAGAARFAAGDRDHRIEVQVPPELRSVANEFNRMIVRIRESEAALADLAKRDGLTTLPNRRAFDIAVEELTTRAERIGEPGALLLVDIDHFKRINDTYGHGAGDDVLRSVARTMTADSRLVDRVFRIGGEEFALVLRATDASDARSIGERLRNTIGAERIVVGGAVITITVSIGIAGTDDQRDPAKLVSMADAALYKAKNGGRNLVVVGGRAA